ncbi:MAG: GNAT family N-acetyltransferase [Bauldia sp.]
MDTIPLSLNGSTDLPAGKIATVVTYYERTVPVTSPPAADPNLSVRRVAPPNTAWYRELYQRIGQNWLQFQAAALSEERLAAILSNPATAILTLVEHDATVGLAELNFAIPGEVEIAVFGVVPRVAGGRGANALMRGTLVEAFRPGIGRAWLRTSALDHPLAMRLFHKHSFRPYKFAIEVVDDPRLTGRLRPEAAPRVPLIHPHQYHGG